MKSAVRVSDVTRGTKDVAVTAKLQMRLHWLWGDAKSVPKDCQLATRICGK